MSNWSDWLDWGGRPAPVQSLNNLAGPTNPNVPYQWMRPTNPAWYPTPQGLKVPMFGPGNTQIYPMFGEGALPTQPLPAAATPVTQASWAQRAGAVGYPTVPQGASVPMFGPDGAPRYPMFGNGAPTPNAPAAAGTPVTQAAWAERAAAAGYPVTPGNYSTPLVPNQPSLMPNARPMNLANPTRTPMFDAAGNPAPIPQPRPAPGPGVPTNPYTQPGATTAMKYPMFDGAGNPAPGPVNAPRPPSLMPNAKPMGTTAPASAPPAPVNVPPPTGPPYTPPAPVNVPPPTGPPAQKLGAGAQNPYLNAAANGAKRAPKQAGPGARAGAATGGAMPSGSAPTNPYSAFWGRNPLNVRGALSATGSVGSKLPGALTAPRSFGPSATGAVGSRLPGWATNQLSGAKNIGAGLGTALALHALPGFAGQGYTAITGRAPSEQGMETAQASAGAAGMGLMFGAPVAAAAGVGTFIGDAVGSSGGFGVANTLRGWMGMDPTDDTIGDILGRTPIGEWFGAGGEQQTEPTASIAPTPESLATIAQTAGLTDPASIDFLTTKYNGDVALLSVQQQNDPEGFKNVFQQLYGMEYTQPEDIQRAVFTTLLYDTLPAAIQNQGAQAAALQNAAMYQDFIGRYMAPIRDQYADLASRAQAAGYGDLALQFQGQGASQESAMRAIPNLEALKAQQAQVNQLAQQQWQASMSGTGGATDPLGDASTLAALGVPTG